MRYSLIRDKKIFELSDHEIEICDTQEEINNFSVKEIMNLLNELQEYDFKDAETYVDIYAILENLTEQNSIPNSEIEILYKLKLKGQGGYSKYLLKIK